LAVCSPPAVIPAPLPLPPPTPGPSASAIGFVCDDGSFISVAFDQSTAVVTEPGAPPVVLFRSADQGGARYVGGLSELIGFAEQIQWTRDGGFARTCRRN
ncbi:MAG: hypothetical protein NUV72_01665, partial [Bauldia sp.]|nr:hypothetical protein [Bauldia sp.]